MLQVPIRASLDFSRQNGVKRKLLNVITTAQVHSRTQCFRQQKHRIMISLASIAFRHSNGRFYVFLNSKQCSKSA